MSYFCTFYKNIYPCEPLGRATLRTWKRACAIARIQSLSFVGFMVNLPLRVRGIQGDMKVWETWEMTPWQAYLYPYLVPQQIPDGWVNSEPILWRGGEAWVCPWDNRVPIHAGDKHCSYVPINCYQEPTSPDNLISPTSQSHFQGVLASSFCGSW